MKTIYLAAAMASALSLSTPASAEFFNFTMAPLLGVSAGQASFDVSCPAASSCDDTDTAWRVFGGLEVNEYISMEVGYADLGKAEISGATSGTAEANGMTFHVIGNLALNPSFSLIGRGGMSILDLNVETTGGEVLDEGDTDVAWSFGVGAQYNVTQALGLRVEWERYFDVGDEHTTGQMDIDLLSAGLIYKF
jgi:OOP family OmpA-OmpF porin